MPSDKSVLGILAPVDAGKTTLAESLLYHCKVIRKLGRVDHQDAFLDTDEMERARGITIFSKQAELPLTGFWEELPEAERTYLETQKNRVSAITLLDTPGHVDFSAEMERTLQVLDYAVLLISGADGIQGHVLTLWKLLSRYHIPTFLFVNKMDQPDTDRGQIMEAIRSQLSTHCVDFSGYLADVGETDQRNDESFWEDVAVCDEAMLTRYLEGETIEEAELPDLIAGRKLIPCFFGSALRSRGVSALLRGLSRFVRAKEYGEDFAARVFKITRDPQGNRLTFLKLLGGSARVKMVMPGAEEKIEQLRIYSGVGYKTVNEIPAGGVCAVIGWTDTYVGQLIGTLGAGSDVQPVLQPVLTYALECPPECDPQKMLSYLRQMEEEDPLLRVNWEERLQEIQVCVMGDVQIEVLKTEIRRRFGVEVSFGGGRIVYRETIAAPVEGVGHFEPLRHYAEVHLWLEPLPLGSGIQCETNVSTDDLGINWQKQVLYHMTSRRHRGVLVGGELTDVRMTLVAGRAHLKHTEGGDFRQATHRAIRQGLMRAESRLLEPYYSFLMEIPADQVGRAMADIQRMSGEFDAPKVEREQAVITGRAPVVCMREYAREVTAYTRGFGHIYFEYGGYGPCHNPEEVLTASRYDPDSDLGQPTGSVFCAHGAGFVVPWNEVQNYMHLEGFYDPELGAMKMSEQELKVLEAPVRPADRVRAPLSLAEADELDEIFRRTYGDHKKVAPPTKKVISAEPDPKAEEIRQKYQAKKQKPKQEEYLLVDGYNFLFYISNETHFPGPDAHVWENLKLLVRTDISAARDRLMDLLSNYQGYTEKHLILVYDAYKVKKNPGEVIHYNDIYVVYTREAETADQYIEKTVHQIVKNYHVTVATSDGMEQKIIFGAGAMRMSSRELRAELDRVNVQIRDVIEP